MAPKAMEVTVKHADIGRFKFAASGSVAYTLTAELTNPGTAANVIDPLTFIADPLS